MKYTKMKSLFCFILIRDILLVILILITQQCTPFGRRNESSPIEIKLVRPNFATMTNKQHPGERIGYRFHEHVPLVYGQVPFSNENASIDIEEISELEEQFSLKEGIFNYNHPIEKDERWEKQDWSFYLNPVKDGVEILFIVKTYNKGLSEYYGIQSCFRLSGSKNSEWRKEVANTPAFSEFDLWDIDTTRPSLTYIRRKGKWESIPGKSQICSNTINDFISQKPSFCCTMGARTPIGERIDNLRSAGELESGVGPYDPIMMEPIDNGLIFRIDISNTWVCGIVWEQTSHVTAHHPADCLHSIVNIGNIPPNSRKAFRGKIYWFKGTKDDLNNHYKNDFE